MRYFFTSDHHFGHAKVIAYAGRTWATSADDMNEKLIERWNSTIAAGDQVYHLGDFSLMRPDKAAQMRSERRTRRSRAA